MRIRSLVCLLSGLLFTTQLPLTHALQSPQSPDDSASFVGRWDISLHAPEHNYGSWLEISSSSGTLSGRMVGKWGHAHPVLDVEVRDGELTFTEPGREEGFSQDVVFHGRFVDGKLTGDASGPKGLQWTWSGRRAPSLARSSPPHWGQPISLFNGKDTQGWTFTDPQNAGNWTVKDAVLTTSRSGSEIVTERKFNDFKLHVEFNCTAKCNSGVYLRGRYEVQVADPGTISDANRRMGAIYGYIAPSPAISFHPGEWETYDITLVGRTVTVKYNGQTVIDKQEIPGVTGGALDSDEGEPGPIYLQGSENAAPTSFRNLIIVPATD